MVRWKRSVLLSVAAVAALACAASPAQAHRKKSVVHRGESFQRAVDAAHEGQTIYVRPGTYRENVVITKDGLSLRGRHAVLEPPASPKPSPCTSPDEPLPTEGICVLGQGDFETGEVSSYVEDVSVSGFKARGYPGSGFFALFARNTTFKGNVADDDDEYGFAAFTSTGTRMLFNRASGSDEAGFYVGDSPDANAKLFGNDSSDNLLGIFVRNALHGTIAGNRVHRNCVGVFFLGDAPGPVGQFDVRFNKIARNTKACPASEEGSAVSGVGVGIEGANGVNVHHNLIVKNVPSGPTDASGGVVLRTGEGGTAPTDNTVRRNVIRGNQPDISWDGTGSGNVLSPNRCATSVPADLCD